MTTDHQAAEGAKIVPITPDVIEDEAPATGPQEDEPGVSRSGPFIKAQSPRKGKWHVSIKKGHLVQWLELEGIAPHETERAAEAARTIPSPFK